LDLLAKKVLFIGVFPLMSKSTIDLSMPKAIIIFPNENTCGTQYILLTGVKFHLNHAISAPSQLTGRFASLVTPNLHQLSAGSENPFGVGMRDIIERALREEDILRHDLRRVSGGKTGGGGIKVYVFVQSGRQKT
jgi:hypothetical protein